ncbi:PLDc N-terminal domain-containing protein [Acetivibrio cellulolyticus]|uniref:PLDc N-terminal domain-containing protein n=1 Tax=Acetivibrio cellulolyticus TaxID=35830 RepID=UPI0001E2EB73|nr:PLD nuclease N-terminal domain-containing protein [Acetivibrio cellulolyticus]
MTEFKEALPFIIPFLLINWTLIIVAMVDLVKRKKVRFGNKWIWGAIILFINMLGPIIYLLARGDDE